MGLESKIYLRKKAELLLEMLPDGLQTSQIARASELTSIENHNEPSTKRGLYIYNDFMISLTRHHKAKLCTNHELLCFGSSQSVSGMRCTST